MQRLQAVRTARRAGHPFPCDLAEILSPVLRHVAPLRQALSVHASAQAWVDEIEEAGVKADVILHDLLAIGRGRPREATLVNLNHVVDHFMKSADYQALKKRHPKVRVEIELAQMLPPVQGAAEALGLLLGHLVTHACESMPGGGVVTIHTTSGHIDRPVGRYGAGQPGDYSSLRVSDTGPGLKLEVGQRRRRSAALRRRAVRRPDDPRPPSPIRPTPVT